MKAQTRQWVRLAEGCFEVANILKRHRAKLGANVVRFYCNQCVEKYLLARLAESHLSLPKKRGLTGLLAPILPWEPDWEAFTSRLQMLGNYGIESRYPGHCAPRIRAETTLKACRSFRAEARLSLGMPRK